MFISNQTAITSKKRQTVTCRSAFDVGEEVVPLQCFYILREGKRDKVRSFILMKFSLCLSGFECVQTNECDQILVNFCLFHTNRRKNFPRRICQYSWTNLENLLFWTVRQNG